MFRQLSDFFTTWSYERSATEKIFSALTNDVLSNKENENIRTLGRLSGHIVETLREMPKRAGLSIEYHDELLSYDKVEDILLNYKNACEDVEAKIAAQWNDAMLTHEVDMYGQKWKLGQVLFSLVTHQAHHRAQITILMRRVGLKVPGVYGPAKEEWAAFGMPAME